MLDDEVGEENEDDDSLTVNFDRGSTKKLEEMAEMIYELEVREGKRKPEDFQIGPGEVLVCALKVFGVLLSKRRESYKIGAYKKIDDKIRIMPIPFYLTDM